MGRRYRLVLLKLMFLLLNRVGSCYGSSQTQVFFNVKTKSQGLPQSFYGYLPKAMPIPHSGPSRKHNGIEIERSLGKP
ncbi:hypothetical protein Lal_00034754 [Lupinus albus]|uniref:Uncharacterized protein n=1 Tax=Lupinus albus TaxID=3870 RepID=A0A6A4QV31_LUPAL|nr:hypothetical protein Lalb_Chr03g0035181 [Lupinus albus]KAF1897052.1 hypothetical protein Lal_00034754 [Lupinus albus]